MEAKQITLGKQVHVWVPNDTVYADSTDNACHITSK